MRIVFHATLAELRAWGLLDLDRGDSRFELINFRLSKDPYSDAYRLHADVLTPRPRKEAP
ncbi:hypothetical protein GCM10017673_47070 [Streptosporangium violaceochromogenes]|nr:hypothetical protein GCM10017673_47070 [Streptosporangium violaceochromogenes]